MVDVVTHRCVALDAGGTLSLEMGYLMYSQTKGSMNALMLDVLQQVGHGHLLPPYTRTP